MQSSHIPRSQTTRACMIGDKGYDSDGYRAALKAKDITPCIPPRKGRILPAGFNKKLYRQQHKSPKHVRQTQRLETCPHPIRSGRTHLHVRYRHSQNRHLLAQLTNPEPRWFCINRRRVAFGLMVWAAPPDGIAKCHAGVVSGRQKARSVPHGILTRSGSIWPSLSLSFTALMLKATSSLRRRCGALHFSRHWRSCQRAWWGMEACPTSHHRARRD